MRKKEAGSLYFQGFQPLSLPKMGVKGKSNVYFCGMVEDIFVFEEDADL